MNGNRTFLVAWYRWHQWLRGFLGRMTSTVLAGFVVVGLVVFLPVVADPEAAPREIVLVTRDMAFYLEGQQIPNPVLTMTAGETVRIVVCNKDAGIGHNFEVPAWDERSAIAYGDATVMARIEVPSYPGPRRPAEH